MLNKVMLIGNAGRDPEMRSFEDGGKIARITLATSERIYYPTTKETKEHTEWHTLVFRSGLAGVVEQYVRKGSLLYVEGRIRNRQWEDENKNKRYSIEILVDEMKMLGGRRNSEESSSSFASTPPIEGMPASPAQSATAQSQRFSPPAPATIENTPVNSEVDDLPF